MRKGSIVVALTIPLLLTGCGAATGSGSTEGILGSRAKEWMCMNSASGVRFTFKIPQDKQDERLDWEGKESVREFYGAPEVTWLVVEHDVTVADSKRPGAGPGVPTLVWESPKGVQESEPDISKFMGWYEASSPKVFPHNFEEVIAHDSGHTANVTTGALTGYQVLGVDGEIDPTVTPRLSNGMSTFYPCYPTSEQK